MNSDDIIEEEIFQSALEDFFLRTGLESLCISEQTRAFYSARPCDVCGGTPGYRHDAEGFHAKDREVKTGFQVCPDCLHFAEHGELPEDD